MTVRDTFDANSFQLSRLIICLPLFVNRTQHYMRIPMLSHTIIPHTIPHIITSTHTHTHTRTTEIRSFLSHASSVFIMMMIIIITIPQPSSDPTASLLAFRLRYADTHTYSPIPHIISGKTTTTLYYYTASTTSNKYMKKTTCKFNTSHLKNARLARHNNDGTSCD